MGWAALVVCTLATQQVAASPQRVTVLVERSEAVAPALLENVVAGIRDAVESNKALRWLPPPPATLAEMMLAMNCPSLDGACISRIIKALDVDVLVWVSAQASQLEFTLLRAWYAEAPPRRGLPWTPEATLRERSAHVAANLFQAPGETSPAAAAAVAPEAGAATPTTPATPSRLPWVLAGAVATGGAALALVLAGGVNAALWTVHVLVWGRSQADVEVPLEGLVTHPVFLGWQRLGPSLLLLSGVVGAGLVLAALASGVAALVLGATAMMPQRE